MPRELSETEREAFREELEARLNRLTIEAETSFAALFAAGRR